jgi:type II secretion system protein N
LPAEIGASNGNVEMKIEKMALGDGKSQVKMPGMAGGLTLEKIDAGTLDMKVTIKEGVAAFEKLDAKGKDLELSGSGSLRLASPFDRSRADITIAYKFDDGYKNRSDRTKVAFELIGNNPILQRATGPDGMVRLQLSGTVTTLRPRPAAAAPNGGAKKPLKRGKKGEEAEAPEPEAEPEAP